MRDGIFTLQNVAKGEHRVFKVETQPENSNFMAGCQVVSLLTKRDPEIPTSWTSFGVLRNDRIAVWHRLRGDGEPSKYDYYALAVPVYWADIQTGFPPNRYRCLEAVPCRRCGHLLVRPESINAGIGPECARRE